MKQNIIDRAQFVVVGGNGGDGAVSWRREKFVPKGGPNGGDGGRGGSVWFEGDENIKDLQDFAGKDRFEGVPGDRGGQWQRHGGNADDVVIKVPLGTEVWVRSSGRMLSGHQLYGDFGYVPLPLSLMPVVKSQNFAVRWPQRVVSSKQQVESEEWIRVADIEEHGQRLLMAAGGDGGRGNEQFKSSRITTPKFAERGEKAEEWEVRLELKVLADVGLVGLPNVGKSTLLSVLTAARPEIANYPFTTLTPNLGVMLGEKSLVLADIPGLIEDAHAGKGLGVEFLKHVERCSVLVYVVAPFDEQLAESGSEMAKTLWKQYEIVRKETEAYSEKLLNKKAMVVVNKADLIQDLRFKIQEFFNKKGVEIVFVSAATSEGLEELKKRINEFTNEPSNA